MKDSSQLLGEPLYLPDLPGLDDTRCRKIQSIETKLGSLEASRIPRQVGEDSGGADAKKLWP